VELSVGKNVSQEFDVGVFQEGGWVASHGSVAILGLKLRVDQSKQTGGSTSAPRLPAGPGSAQAHRRVPGGANCQTQLK